MAPLQDGEGGAEEKLHYVVQEVYLMSAFHMPHRSLQTSREKAGGGRPERS